MGRAVHDGRSLFYVSHKITMRNIHGFETEMQGSDLFIRVSLPNRFM